jgi:hypothetical protein
LAGTSSDLKAAEAGTLLNAAGAKVKVGDGGAGIPCAWRDAPNVVEAITGFLRGDSQWIRLGAQRSQEALASEKTSSGIDAEKLE